MSFVGGPALSVVVPTRDRPELLRRAVRSILDQDYDGDVHCLIVFDGGDPVPVEVPTSQRRSLRMLTNLRTPGLAGARNTGILEADGDLVAFCDDDDEWMPDKLRAQVRELEAEPQAEIVGSGIEVRYEGRPGVVRIPPAPRIGMANTRFGRSGIAISSENSPPVAKSNPGYLLMTPSQ